MTLDDIRRIAREAGFTVDARGEILEGDDWHTQTELIEEFARLVAAAEREAIIDIVAMHGGSVEIEAAIRARGKNDTR